MPDEKKRHALRRVREGLADFPDRSRMAEVKNFAQWVGVSESLIRNVENGVTDLSRKLAHAVQRKTGVSEEWLLRNPGDEEPIENVRGREWGPRGNSPFGYLPNFERLLAACPTLLPAIVARLVEIQMLRELNEEGRIETMLLLLHRLDSKDFFEEDQGFGLPSGWLRLGEAQQVLVDLGIDLLMDRRPELEGERHRDLEHLRVNEPTIPEHSALPKLYQWMESQRNRPLKKKS